MSEKNYTVPVYHAPPVADAFHSPMETPSKVVPPSPRHREMEAARTRLSTLQGAVIVGDILAPMDDVEWTADVDNM